MPWKARDARRHTRKAGGALSALWAKVANRTLKESGDEGKAVRIANYVVKRKKR